ncbi:Tetracyclin repressor, C-terminal all-alpha domain [Amycolatopsis arida]|uniref:Tetracyclin repressor, C-terminal all-alpha domain n=1 Tax=Amycolatopsis arida TaxID=587909 RepID=A0A1I6ATI2_9PSEU|nr:TetR/AcrR family transcriptional regulator C-terminal domain-containing protein [Amycolatopsis arida]TDX97530.1 tetracycline repressor-like protein [Amycolatopsis arida]SFQ71998.1 Tetracyclin repressor, C-terminal all-alpha domain [Amycolatopsis arida]
MLDLALDHVFGEVEIPAASGDWRADATELVGRWRGTLLRHPWSGALLGRPLLGPNVLARSEFLHATLAAAGLAEPRLAAAAYAVSNYVIGSVLMQLSARAGDERREATAIRRHLADHRDRYPTLAAHGPLVGTDWDASFTLGLDCLLDGIQARGGRGGGGAPAG